MLFIGGRGTAMLLLSTQGGLGKLLLGSARGGPHARPQAASRPRWAAGLEHAGVALPPHGRRSRLLVLCGRQRLEEQVEAVAVVGEGVLVVVLCSVFSDSEWGRRRQGVRGRGGACRREKKRARREGSRRCDADGAGRCGQLCTHAPGLLGRLLATSVSVVACGSRSSQAADQSDSGRSGRAQRLRAGATGCVRRPHSHGPLPRMPTHPARAAAAGG